jgi:hypothetical protein
MEHDELIEAAKAAINKVFSDKSVPPATTLESMEELQAEIESNIEALRCDLGDD